MRKPTICICENKDTDRRLCFRHSDSTIPLLPISKVSRLILYFPCFSGQDDYDEEKPNQDQVSLTESVKPYDSDEDITEEYGGDFDVSKFNEDGSFIGIYGDKKSKTKEATV